ncbi:MAG: hypothetical protein ACR2OM_11395, partial [Aestuariivirgaceae bacterium]
HVMTLIRIILSFGLLLASGSLVAARTCETPAMTARHFAKVQPGSQIALLKGPRSKRFLKAFNAYPPATGYVGDAVVIIRLPHETRRVYLGIYQGGCLKHKGSITRKLAELLMKQSNPGGVDGQAV